MYGWMEYETYDLLKIMNWEQAIRRSAIYNLWPAFMHI